jgi:Chitobiase/beta-hexosaminidase C-terminal domain
MKCSPGILLNPWLLRCNGLVVLFLLVLSLMTAQQKAWAVSPPAISPGTGLYFPGPTVTITATSGATIYYTTDGTIPTLSSQVYSTSWTVNATTTVNAIAVLGGVSSSVATVNFTVDPSTQPIFNLGYPISLWLRSDLGVTSSAGKVSTWLDQSGQGNHATQTISANQPSLSLDECNGYSAITTGSNAFFNLPSDFSSLPNPWFFFATKPTSTSNGVLLDLGNGSSSDNVTTSSAGSTANFSVTTSGGTNSVSASSALTLGQYQVLESAEFNSNYAQILVNDVQAANNLFSFAPATVTRTVNHIGTDYSGSANFYSGGFLEILALSDVGLTGSVINLDQVAAYMQSRYQISSTIPAAPIISVGSGTLSGPTQVAIATPADCICRYTTDGSTPSSTSPLYSGPINVFYSQTLNAIALKSGGQSSTVSSASYLLDSTQWPAPNPADTTPLQVNVQSPAN